MKRKSWVPEYSVPVWARRSKFYMMEFIATIAGIITVTFLLDSAFFAIAQYFGDASQTNGSYNQMNLWVVAMLLVWLPVTALLYKRTRFEELERPKLASTKLRRFFLYIFLLLMLLSAIGFAIMATYGTIATLFDIADVHETFLQQATPAFLAAMLHGYVFVTFMKENTALRIKEFAAVFAAVGGIVAATLLVTSFVQARTTVVDDKISQDLGRISNEVNNYYNDRSSTPQAMTDLKFDKALERRSKKYGYSYTRQGDQGYKLCAIFKAKSEGQFGSDYSPAIYPGFKHSDFTRHGKGTVCFDLDVYTSNFVPFDGGSSTSPIEPAIDLPKAMPVN